MATLITCINKHARNLPDFDAVKADLLNARAGYIRDGYKPEAADMAAVEDAISELEAERADIIAQIKKQSPQIELFPEEPKKPEKVAEKPAAAPEAEKPVTPPEAPAAPKEEPREEPKPEPTEPGRPPVVEEGEPGEGVPEEERPERELGHPLDDISFATPELRTWGFGVYNSTNYKKYARNLVEAVNKEVLSWPENAQEWVARRITNAGPDQFWHVYNDLRSFGPALRLVVPRAGAITATFEDGTSEIMSCAAVSPMPDSIITKHEMTHLAWKDLYVDGTKSKSVLDEFVAEAMDQMDTLLNARGTARPKELDDYYNGIKRKAASKEILDITTTLETALQTSNDWENGAIYKYYVAYGGANTMNVRAFIVAMHRKMAEDLGLALAKQYHTEEIVTYFVSYPENAAVWEAMWSGIDFAKGRYPNKQKTYDAGTPEHMKLDGLSEFFLDEIRKGTKYDKKSLQAAVASLFGMTRNEWLNNHNIQHKQIEEAFEYAIVKRAKEIVGPTTPLPETQGAIFTELEKLYKSQPLLAERTSTSIKMQAYSTPVHLGFLTQLFAGVDKTKTVADLTAGTGMLLYMADPAKVWANELQPERQQVLKDQGYTVTGEDAGIPNMFANRRKTVDSMTLNPPFGGLKEPYMVDEYPLKKLEHLIVANSLAYLKDDGKAAIIIGGHNFESIKGNRKMSIPNGVFLNWLYMHYNVLANIDIPGTEYSRQGTSFPIRLIVIHGRKAEPEGHAPMYEDQYDKVESLPELFKILEEIESGKRKPYRVPGRTEVGGERTPPKGPGGPGVEGPGPKGPVLGGPIQPEGAKPSGEVPPGGVPGGPGGVLPGGPGVRPAGPEAGAGGGAGAPGAIPPVGGTEKPISGPSVRGPGGEAVGPEVPGGEVRPEGELPGEPGGLQEGTPEPVAPGVPGSGQLKGKSEIDDGWDEFSDDDIENLLDNAEKKAADIPVPETLKPAEEPEPREKVRPTKLGRRFINWWYGRNLKGKSQQAHPGMYETKGEKAEAKKEAEKKEKESHLTPEQKELRDLLGDSFDDIHDMFKVMGYKKIAEIRAVLKDLSEDPLYIDKFKPMIEKAFQYAKSRGLTKEELFTKLFTAYGAKIKPYLAQYVRDKRKEFQEKKNELYAPTKNEYQVPYAPFSKGPIIDDTLIPKFLKDATDEALQRVYDEVGDLDAYVMKKMKWADVGKLYSYLSADQIDAMALIFWNFDHGSAFINGDQVGVGKGRTGGATDIQALGEGGKPVYVTADVKLFTDVYRDISDVGYPQWNPFIQASKEKELASIFDQRGKIVRKVLPGPKQQELLNDVAARGPAGSKLYQQYDGMITTYSQYQSGHQKKGAIRKAVGAAIMEGQTVILDESQLASGNTSQRGEYFRARVAAAARVLYMSGTFAKRPELMALYMKTDLRWLNMNYDQMVDALRRGGTPLMEMLSLTLARAGQLIRREKDFTGIGMNTFVNTKEKESDTKRADKYIDTWRTILGLSHAIGQEIRSAINRAMAVHDTSIWVYGIEIPHALRINTENRYVTNYSVGDFARMAHDAVKFYLYAAKSKFVAEEAIRGAKERSHVEEDPAHPGRYMIVQDGETELEDVKTKWGETIKRHKLALPGLEDLDYEIAKKSAAPNGRKPFIAVDNTLETAMNDMIAKGAWKIGEVYDPSFLDLNRRFIDKALTIKTTSPQNQVIKIKIPEENLTGDAEAFMEMLNRKFEELSNPEDWIPGSPIDYIRQKLLKAGLSVGEISGREKHADFSKSLDKPTLQNRPSDDRNKGIQLLKFNGNHESKQVYDALLVNRSASTGVSAHAGPDFGDQRPRMYLGAQVQGNVDDEMQMRGRINRKGQVALPYYASVYLDLPMEVRPAAAMMKKEKQVNANTSSNSDSPLRSKQFPDLNNHYGDELTVEWLTEHEDLAARMGLTANDIPSVKFMWFTSKLALYPTALQEEFFDDLELGFALKKEELMATGQWDLETSEHDYQAKTNNVEIVIAGLKEDNDLGASTFREEVDIIPPTKPFKYDELSEIITKNLEKYGAAVGKTQRKLPYSYKELGYGANKVFQIYRLGKEHDVSFATEEKAKDYVDTMNKAELKHLDLREYVDSQKVVEHVVAQLRADFDAWLTKKIKDSSEAVPPRPFLPEKYRNQANAVFNKLMNFKIGALYRFSWNDDSMPDMRAVLMDYKISKPKFSSPAAGSKVTLSFAVDNSLRTLQIPISKFIVQPQQSNAKIYSRFWADAVTNEWDSYVGGIVRERRYLLTNNVPQGYLHATPGSRMVRFTREGGAWDIGILLPMGYKPSSHLVNQNISLNKDQVKVAVLANKLMADRIKDVRIYKERWQDNFYIRVPVGKKGEIFHQNETLLRLAVNNNFSGRQDLTAWFTPDKLDEVLEVLHKLDVRFELPRGEFNTLFSDFIKKVLEKRSQKLKRKLDEQKKEEATPAAVVREPVEVKAVLREAEQRTQDYFDGEDTEEGARFKDDWRGTISAVWDSIKNRKEGWTRERPDTTWLERMAASPEWYFQKVPAAWRVYRSAIEKNDEYHANYNDITGQDALMGYIKKYSKENPKGYESLGKLLVRADQNETIYTPDSLRMLGYNAEFIDAWTAFRKMMANGLKKLQQDLRDLIAEYEKRGKELPTIVSWDGNKQIRVNLKVALAMMGKMEGWYFPRMRKQGRFNIMATKEGAPSRYEFYDTRTMANIRYAQLKAQGYTVVKQKSKGLPEDVFEVANRTMGLNQIINSALDRVMARGEAAQAFSDFNLEAKRVQIDEKNSEVWITGPTTKAMNDVFKGFGGRWYPKATIKGWHFLNPPADLEKQILEALTLTIGIPGEMEELTLFAASIATSVADAVKGRGFRGRMIARGEKKGLEVYRGYEEDPLKAASQYATSIASGVAKKNMALKMVRAVSGTDARREDYPTWKDYIAAVKNRRIDANSQKNIYHDVKVYMQEQLRNEQFADRVIGFIKSITILKYLGLRAATAAVNLTSLLTSVPAAMKTYGQISYPTTAYWLGKGMDAYRVWKWGDRESLDPDVRRMFAEIEKKGWDQAQLTTEAMGILRSKLRTSYQWLIDVSMGLFAITERINRVSTIAGSFMALKKQGQDYGAAISIAKQISDSAHGVYGKVARPHLAQGEHLTAQAGKAFYVFSKFSHNYLQLAYDVGFRKKDKGALLHMMAAPAILGGVASSVLGPPFMQAMAALLGAGDDDTPKEGEERFYQFVDDTFGHAAMELARHGVLGGLGAGISVKGSLSINPVESVPTTLPDFLGAPGNVISDVYYGGKAIYEGDTKRGIEKIMPRFVGFPMQALREAEAGVTTGRNIPKYLGTEKMQPTVTDTIYRILNFNPAHMAEMKERKRSEETMIDKYEKQRTLIYSKIREFYQQPPNERTEDQYSDVLADIMEYNRTIQTKQLYTVKGISFITKESIKGALKQKK